jgi:hypothetical protein
MNILYIIGNGFDLNLKLETRYTDFYNYYTSIDNKSEIINKLKASISEDISTWSDLELALGLFTTHLTTNDQVDEVLEDIVKNLSDYLQEEESKFDVSSIDVLKFLNQLHNPEQSLAQEDVEEIETFKNEQSPGQWNIDIITLNYTRTIERIISDYPIGTVVSTLKTGYGIVLNSIKHIHGYVDKRMILGVNDISQIGQASFHDNQDIIEALIKTASNRSQRHMIDRQCEKNVSDADLICIFGSSIGNTDNFWWNLIGQQLRRKTKLIIFDRKEDDDPRFGHKSARAQRKIKKEFLDKTDLSDEEKQQCLNNIYIGINTDMFSIKTN